MKLLIRIKSSKRKVIFRTNASINPRIASTIYLQVAVIRYFIVCSDNCTQVILKSGTQPIVKIMAVENEKEWEFSIQRQWNSLI